MAVKNMDGTRDIIILRATFLIQWCLACSGGSMLKIDVILVAPHAILMYVFSSRSRTHFASGKYD